MVTKGTKIRWAVAAAVLLTILAAPGLSYAQADDERVYPRDAVVGGKTYAQWAATWWQWVAGLPTTDSDGNVYHPLQDPDGSLWMHGQTNGQQVLFLGGFFCAVANCGNSSGTREITVAPGKALFFPILNFEIDNILCHEQTFATPPQLAAILDDVMACAKDVEADLDGRPIRNLQQFRFFSPQFDMLEAQNGLCTPAYDPTNETGRITALDDGWYLMLKPLKKGTHKLHFKGSIPSVPCPNANGCCTQYPPFFSGEFGLEVSYLIHQQ